MSNTKSLFFDALDENGNPFHEFREEFVPEALKNDKTIMSFLRAMPEVSKIIQSGYRDRQMLVEKKEDGSVVTIYDKSSNDYLKKHFAHEKDVIYIGEEDDVRPSEKDWDKTKTYYIFDSIDGTLNFKGGAACATTGVKKEYIDGKWQSTAGMVYNHKTKECYLATKGGGAFRSDGFFVEKIDRAKAVQESEEKSKNTIFASTYGHTIDKDFEHYIKKNSYKHFNASPRTIGSTSLELIECATSNKFAILYGPSFNAHDTDAALLICEEAGVKVSRDTGLRLRDKDKKTILEVDSIVCGGDNFVKDTAKRIRISYNVGIANPRSADAKPRKDRINNGNREEDVEISL